MVGGLAVRRGWEGLRGGDDSDFATSLWGSWKVGVEEKNADLLWFL
jgi:hypothetical protein